MVKYVRESRPNFSVVTASAEGVAERWAKSYPASQWPGDRQRTAQHLIDFGDAADPNQVANAIGNKSWTHPFCVCCRDYKEKAIDFDPSDNGTMVCSECIGAAAAALRDRKVRQS